MTTAPSLRFAAALSAFASALAAAVAFVLNILMARGLGPEGRGQVAWLLQMAYLLAPLLAVGVDRVALRGVFNTRPGVAPTLPWITTAPIALLIGVGLAPTFGPAPILAIAVGLGIAVQNIIRADALSSESQKPFVAWIVATQGLTIATGIALYLFEVDDYVAWALSYCWTTALSGVLAARGFRRARNYIRRHWRHTIRFSQSAGSWGTFLTMRADKLLIPLFLGPTALGRYVVIATAAESVMWVTQAVSDGAVSRTSASEADRRDLLRSSSRVAGLATALSLASGVGIYLVLIPLLGPQFQDTSEFIIPLCISVVAWAMYRQCMSYWQAAAPDKAGRLDLAHAVLTVAILCAAITIGGTSGAAWGCVVAYTLLVIIAISRWHTPTNDAKGNSL